jgi:hypothetical protein
MRPSPRPLTTPCPASKITSIRIKVGRCLAAGPGAAIVAVEDAGVGFHEEKAATLFEAFNATTAGHGATFHFALPGMR